MFLLSDALKAMFLLSNEINPLLMHLKMKIMHLDHLETQYTF